jgi:hypothetical protein
MLHETDCKGGAECEDTVEFTMSLLVSSQLRIHATPTSVPLFLHVQTHAEVTFVAHLTV